MNPDESKHLLRSGLIHHFGYALDAATLSFTPPAGLLHFLPLLPHPRSAPQRARGGASGGATFFEPSGPNLTLFQFLNPSPPSSHGTGSRCGLPRGSLSKRGSNLRPTPFLAFYFGIRD